MGLNLNALKNISLAPANSNGNENTPTSLTSPSQATPLNMSQEAISVPENITKVKTPGTAPKISLVQLKKASGIDNLPVVPEIKQEPVQATFVETVADTKAEVTVIDIVNNTVDNSIQTKEIINAVPENEIIAISPVENTMPMAEEVVKNPLESKSIVIDGQKPAKEELMEATEPKEFFPNFQVSNKMDLGEDLLGLEDIIMEEEKTVIPEEKSLIITNNAPEITSEQEESRSIIANEESIISSETESLPQETVLNEVPVEMLSDEAIVITPEYVAEVKTELSEQRRAGFRFFVQNKTKIMAGVGILFSLSVIALFSGSFLGADIQKSGKSNIQETMPTETVTVSTGEVSAPSETGTISPVIETSSLPPETSNYELGRDYSITKNTKKNIRTKASIETASGGEISTQ